MASQAPVRVSPLIKAGRWSALLVGVLYGSKHYNTLSKREVELREIEAKQKVVRDAQLAKERAVQNREQMLYLAKETGTPVPADFDKQYPVSS
ncbi:ATP synthase subunit e, mitochondrial-like [Pollicipes pollicipes]|uniref:ATP synthase subunit e, mitochondrial-like n=1 Tax=Pollicipes pollicipes TaxID=41117 RepID=UPI0018856E3D|nr:ATP synthase subunit e, mitochondrial-like [Pollicipes pollicipes]XP_037068167.1 ATP synthase subunit e, mitochondrial-like [Pollicipes pollicipes]